MRGVILITIIVVGGITIFQSIPQIAYSAPTATDSTRTFGIGTQSAPFPILGLGIIYNLNEKLGIQLIGKTGWDIDVLSLRALYRFKNGFRRSLYACGLLGMFRDDEVQRHIFAPEETDVAPGFGVGVGGEYFLSGLPNVGWNLELDFIYIDFEKHWWQYDYKAFSLIMIGFGVHYFF